MKAARTTSADAPLSLPAEPLTMKGAHREYGIPSYKRQFTRPLPTRHHKPGQVILERPLRLRGHETGKRDPCHGSLVQAENVGHAPVGIEHTSPGIEGNDTHGGLGEKPLPRSERAAFSFALPLFCLADAANVNRRSSCRGTLPGRFRVVVRRDRMQRVKPVFTAFHRTPRQKPFLGLLGHRSYHATFRTTPENVRNRQN